MAQILSQFGALHCLNTPYDIGDRTGTPIIDKYSLAISEQRKWHLENRLQLLAD